MTLSDFFHPHTIQSLLVFILFLLACEIVGFFIQHIFAFPKNLRSIHWLLGLGIITFTWFLLHFFIPFRREFVAVTIGLMAIGDLPIYIKKKAWISLFKTLKDFHLPVIIFLLFAKAAFFLSSLPPKLWDELAYHYISPFTLLNETTWQFADPLVSSQLYFFHMMPRFLETASTLLFSLSYSYASARLLHLFIFFTALYFLGQFLKKHFSQLTALIFIFIAIFFHPHPVQSAMLGYTDAAAASFMLIYFVFLLKILIEKKYLNFLPASVFFALAIATKYTSLSFLTASSSVFLLLLLLFEWRQIIKFLKTAYKNTQIYRFISVTLLLVLVFGGYWYLRNLVITGNPIYPFLFKCWGTYTCGEGQNYFSSWAIPFALSSAKAISDQILLGSNSLRIALPLAWVFLFSLGIKLKNNAFVKTALMLFLTICIEILLVSKLAGFEIRYYFHWVFLSLISLSLPFVIVKQFKKLSMTWALFFFFASNIFLFLFLPPVFAKTTTHLKYFYKLPQVSDNDRWFARGKLSFADWLKPFMPHLHPTIEWCGEQREEPITIYTADPEMIFYFHGLSKAFYLNCELRFIKDIVQHDVANENIFQEIAKSFIAENPDAVYLSTKTCPDALEARYPGPNPNMQKYSNLNRELVCSGVEVRPQIYSFDQTKKPYYDESQ